MVERIDVQREWVATVLGVNIVMLPSVTPFAQVVETTPQVAKQLPPVEQFAPPPPPGSESVGQFPPPPPPGTGSVKQINSAPTSQIKLTSKQKLMSYKDLAEFKLPMSRRPASRQIASNFGKDGIVFDRKNERMNEDSILKIVQSSIVEEIGTEPIQGKEIYTPPTELKFTIANPIQLMIQYAPVMHGTYQGFSVEELTNENSPELLEKCSKLAPYQERFSELMVMDDLIRSPENVFPNSDGTAALKEPEKYQLLFERAIKHWFTSFPESPKPREISEFISSFAGKNISDRFVAFKNDYKAGMLNLPNIKELLVDKKLSEKLALTENALGVCPNAVCLPKEGRPIYLNTDALLDENGKPDYAKTEATMIHESHHAMSKGFVVDEIFGSELHDANWNFDEIMTEHYTMKRWVAKGYERDEYFKYTSYFKGKKVDLKGNGWMGNQAPNLFNICSEQIFARAYFKGDEVAWQEILKNQEAILNVVKDAY